MSQAIQTYNFVDLDPSVTDIFTTDIIVRRNIILIFRRSGKLEGERANYNLLRSKL